jgi:hypothetical protein
MNGWTCDKCCRMAIIAVARMGVSATNNKDVLMRWYRMFCERHIYLGHDEAIFKQYLLTKKVGLVSLVRLDLFQKMEWR